MKPNPLFILCLATVSLTSLPARSQTTAFTYQGRLETNGAPVSGVYDLRFSVYDAVTNGNVVGGPLTNATTAVSNGLFNVTLDFGAAPFSGASRWLDIGARTNGSSGAYQGLSPRQPITSTPYALRAANAASFTNAVSDSQLSTNIARLNANNNFTGTNSLNAVDLRLGVSGDANNGLGVYSASKLFGGFNPDGSVLYGNSGGTLGTSFGGKTNRLFWNIYGVGINTNPVTDFQVLGLTPQYTAIFDSVHPIGTWLHLQNRSAGGQEWRMWTSGSGNGEGAGKLIFDDTASYRLVFSTNGNTGVGTLTPGSALEVNGGIRARGGAPGAGGINNVGYAFNGNGGDQDSGMFSLSDGELDFYVNAQQTLQLVPGALGINVSPSAPLHVSSSGFPNAIIEGSSTTGTWMDLRNTSTAGTNWVLISSASGNGEGPGKLLFNVGSGPTSLTEQPMVIQADGKVGIGTPNPGFLLEVNGTAGKPGGGSWSSASDARLKKNIHQLAGALDKLLALRGVSFEYIDPAKIHELSGERMGLIAQEVEKVFPDWVETGPDGYKRVTVRGLEALVVEAMRQLREEHSAQLSRLQKVTEARIEALQSRSESLEKRLEALENKALIGTLTRE